MRQSALSTPESAASPSAALERLLGVARTHGPFSNSGTMPRVVSAQIASGLVFRAASVASSGMPAAIAAASLGRIRSPFQRLYHDVGCVDFRREQFGGHVNDDLAGPLPALTGHRGGGTYAKDFLSRRESLSQTPHQHCDVCTLPAPVGVKLIEDKEIQALAVADDTLVELVLSGGLSAMRRRSSWLSWPV